MVRFYNHVGEVWIKSGLSTCFLRCHRIV